MSIQTQIDRISNNVQNTLNTIAETGVEVGTGSDALPAAATALANEKAPINHTHEAESIGQLPVIVLESTDGQNYTATVPWITELTPGAKFTAIAKTASTTTGPLLNVNGLGNKGLRCLTGVGTASAYLGASDGWIMANKAIDLMYTGSAWVAIGVQRTSVEALMGTLGVTKGGTGASAPATALANLNGVSYGAAQELTEEQKAQARANIGAQAEETKEVVTILSDNLFDKSTATAGKGWYHSSSGTQLMDAADCYAGYVELRGAGTYRTKVPETFHGEAYAQRVPLMKADKTWIKNITGTVTDTGDDDAWDLEFIVTQAEIDAGAAYYPITVRKKYIDTMMAVKDREYPSEYIPYGYIEVEVEADGESGATNILKGKTAVFLGDSICAGTTTLSDAAEYGYGWGGIIGEGNGMTWQNFGRNGGTITPISSVDSARWVPTQVDLALAAYPNADYVIFEGGTNDADTLKADGLGTFSVSGYAPSDDSNFTGAFETLILKILNAYPNAKVGYIVAQKMGVANDYSSSVNRRAFFDRAVEICEKWGIPVLDLWKCNPLNPKLSAHYDSSLTADEANTAGKFYTDGQHLTLAGYQRITPQIEAFMRSL